MLLACHDPILSWEILKHIPVSRFSEQRPIKLIHRTGLSTVYTCSGHVTSHRDYVVLQLRIVSHMALTAQSLQTSGSILLVCHLESDRFHGRSVLRSRDERQNTRGVGSSFRRALEGPCSIWWETGGIFLQEIYLEEGY